jgi:hypothetical protein
MAGFPGKKLFVNTPEHDGFMTSQILTLSENILTGFRPEAADFASDPGRSEFETAGLARYVVDFK